MKNNIIESKININYQQPFFKAFANAFNGIFKFFQTERNAKVQLAAAIAVIIAAFIFQINLSQWIMIIVCIAAVFSLEMMNSAIENLCNMVHSNYHPIIKKIKDVAAGAVLVASIASVIIALIIFVPKIY